MALDKTDLEYIKQTIEWLNEHTVLIDDNRTNCEMLYNSVQNSLQALESALANADTSGSNCTIHGVSNWVATRDKMPPANTSVLCHDGYRIVQNSWMAHTSMDSNRFKEKFTHWMPIPEPPYC